MVESIETAQFRTSLPWAINAVNTRTQVPSTAATDYRRPATSTTPEVFAMIEPGRQRCRQVEVGAFGVLARS